MKTRIRKKEYNDGKNEYICEKFYFPEDAIAALILSITFLSVFIYNGFEIKHIFDVFSIALSITFLYASLHLYNHRWGRLTQDEQNTFDNLEDAKKLINSVLKKEMDDKAIEYGNETKKETIIKHP